MCEVITLIAPSGIVKMSVEELTALGLIICNGEIVRVCAREDQPHRRMIEDDASRP